MRKRIYALALGIVCLCTTISCNEWLDIKPEDRIEEEQLFESKEGFEKALIGIYANLNRPSAYGLDLTAGMVDVMAQYYDCTAYDPHNYSVFMTYAYEEGSARSKYESIWTTMYMLIANVNALLEACEKQEGILKEHDLRRISGEAYALRGMLHFDLLRLWGPIGSEDAKKTQSIPYVKDTRKVVKPILSVDSIILNVLKDLKQAETLLEGVDPIIGANRNTINQDNHIYRLNYYAVQALFARVYLWGGEKELARSYAVELIEKLNMGEDAPFPFVDDYHISILRDPLYYPEILFGCYNNHRYEDIYRIYLDPEGNKSSYFHTVGSIADGRVSNRYDDQNDIRYKAWGEKVIKNTVYTYSLKFDKNENSDGQSESLLASYNRTMPLLRMSELYLIAAECTDNVEEAYEQYINTLRYHRKALNLSGTTEEEKDRHIYEEYIREFIGEGQTFFYFKRKMLANIPDGVSVDKMMNIAQESYTLPLPKSETDNRN